MINQPFTVRPFKSNFLIFFVFTISSPQGKLKFDLQLMRDFLIYFWGSMLIPYSSTVNS